MSDHCLECNLSSCHHLYCHDSVLVSSLRRRIRELKETLQRKELHLDLLRRKLAVQEDHAKAKCLVIAERDEANCRVRELTKQIERLQCELSDAKMKIRCLNNDLADATGYKITALERARKIDDLQKRLLDCESQKIKYTNEVCHLKDQVRSTSDVYHQERHVSEHTMQTLREELARTKDNLLDVSRKESSLQSFKSSVAKILGVILPAPDYELIGRLQKLVDAHHDFTVVSKRYDDPVLRMAARSPTPCFTHHETIDCEIVKSKACPYI